MTDKKVRLNYPLSEHGLDRSAGMRIVLEIQDGEEVQVEIHTRERIHEILTRFVNQVKTQCSYDSVNSRGDYIVDNGIDHDRLLLMLESTVFFYMREIDFLGYIGEPCRSCLIRVVCMKESRRESRIWVKTRRQTSRIDMHMCIDAFYKLSEIQNREIGEGLYGHPL